MCSWCPPYKAEVGDRPLVTEDGIRSLNGAPVGRDLPCVKGAQEGTRLRRWAPVC